MKAIKFLGYANEYNGIEIGMTLGGELQIFAEGKNIILFDGVKSKALYEQMRKYYEVLYK